LLWLPSSSWVCKLYDFWQIQILTLEQSYDNKKNE
jgi:hypothetical protein